MTHKLSTQQLFGVDGIVAVVTGASSGLGASIAKSLANNGAAKVYITGRRLEKLEEVAEAGVNGNIIPIQGSVTSHDDLQAAVDKITKEVGHIDLLVNNAGQTTHDTSLERQAPGRDATLSEIRDYYFNYRKEDVWHKCLSTNITAVFLTSMAFLELLDAGNKRRDKDAPRSQIITIGSVGGLTRFTDGYIYNASKAGVHHLTKNMGEHLIPFNIRTNVIAPGWFPTEMTDGVVKSFEPYGGVMPKDLVPQERMGKEEELCGMVLYLASKAGTYCNGSLMVVDGGCLVNHSGT